MKRVVGFIILIIVISFCVSLFVDAEEKVIQNNDDIKIENVNVDSSIMIDNSITKLNFFRKNISVIVTYK